MFHQEESCLSCSMARLLPITDRKENGKQANTAGTTTSTTISTTTKTTKTNKMLAKLKTANLTKTTTKTTTTSRPLTQTSTSTSTSTSASCEDIMDGYFCETAFQDEYCNEMFYWNGRNIAQEWCKRYCNNCF